MRQFLNTQVKEKRTKMSKGIPLQKMIKDEKRKEKERKERMEEEYLYWEYVLGTWYDSDSAGDR